MNCPGRRNGLGVGAEVREGTCAHVVRGDGGEDSGGGAAGNPSRTKTTRTRREDSASDPSGASVARVRPGKMKLPLPRIHLAGTLLDGTWCIITVCILLASSRTEHKMYYA